MSEKKDDVTTSDEQKPKPTFESGTMQDVQTMRQMAAVNRKGAVDYGKALDEIRTAEQNFIGYHLFFDELETILQGVGK